MTFEKILVSLSNAISKVLVLKKDLSNSEEKLLAEAFALQALVERKSEILENLITAIKEKKPEFDITPEFEANAYQDFLENTFHDNFIYIRAKALSMKLEGALGNLYDAFFIDLWNTSTKDNDNIDRYTNTPDQYFNEVAFYWKFSKEIQKEFPDIDVFFDCIIIYLKFVKNYSKPQYCKELIVQKISDHELSEEQQLVFLDNLAEFLFKNEDERLVKIYIEVINLRNSISPIIDDVDVDFWTIERLRERLNGHQSILEKIKYLERSKLEYSQQAEELGVDIGVAEEIDIEIEYYREILKGIETYELKKVFSDEIYSILSLEGYNQLVNFINLTGRNLEKFSALNEVLDEERIRDYFIPALNSVSPYHSVSGETFNKKGKADLIVQDVNGGIVFIAEFKLWRGVSYLLEGIEQLFERYVTWREKKAALVIINKSNKGFSKLIHNGIEALKGHNLFDSLNYQRNETSYSMTFRHIKDTERKILLEVIFFNFMN